jgi:hypothetical protein
MKRLNESKITEQVDGNMVVKDSQAYFAAGDTFTCGAWLGTDLFDAFINSRNNDKDKKTDLSKWQMVKLTAATLGGAGVGAVGGKLAGNAIGNIISGPNGGLDDKEIKDRNAYNAALTSLRSAKSAAQKAAAATNTAPKDSADNKQENCQTQANATAANLASAVSSLSEASANQDAAKAATTAANTAAADKTNCTGLAAALPAMIDAAIRQIESAKKVIDDKAGDNTTSSVAGMTIGGTLGAAGAGFSAYHLMKENNRDSYNSDTSSMLAEMEEAISCILYDPATGRNRTVKLGDTYSIPLMGQ